MDDTVATQLLYHQATHDVRTQRYPIRTQDITVLGALQLQSTFGDFKKEVHYPGWLYGKLDQYMPAELFTKNGKRSEKLMKEWEQALLAKYQKVCGFSSLESQLNY